MDSSDVVVLTNSNRSDTKLVMNLLLFEYYVWQKIYCIRMRYTFHRQWANLFFTICGSQLLLCLLFLYNCYCHIFYDIRMDAVKLSKFITSEHKIKRTCPFPKMSHSTLQLQFTMDILVQYLPKIGLLFPAIHTVYTIIIN